MRQHGEFKATINGVNFDVEFTVSGWGGDMELDEVGIFIGDQELSEVLDRDVIRRIDELCYSNLPSPPDIEPDEDR